MRVRGRLLGVLRYNTIISRLDTSLSTDIHRSPTATKVRRGACRKNTLLAGLVRVILAFFDRFQTAIVYAYEGIKI